MHLDRLAFIKSQRAFNACNYVPSTYEQEFTPPPPAHAVNFTYEIPLPYFPTKFRIATLCCHAIVTPYSKCVI